MFNTPLLALLCIVGLIGGRVLVRRLAASPTVPHRDRAQTPRRPGHPAQIPAPRDPADPLELGEWVDVEGLSAAALGFAESGDYPALTVLIDDLADSGRPSIDTAMRCWAAAYVEQVAPNAAPDALVELRFDDLADRRVDPADVDPAELWAGRFLAAHVTRDDAQIAALLATLTSDRVAMDRAVTLLFQVAFHTTPAAVPV